MGLDGPGKIGDSDNKGAGLSLQQPGSQPSAVEQITSAIESEKQYAGTDVKKMVDDALSADGREQKDRADVAEAKLTKLTGEHEGLTTQFNSLSEQVNTMVQAKNDAEADAVKDNPEALTSLRVRQANQTETIRLKGVDALQKAREVSQNERETSLTQKDTSLNIRLAAMAAQVDEKTLTDLVPDGDKERLARAITIIKQGAGAEIDSLTGKPKPAGLTNAPASVISAGGDARSVSEKMLEDAKKK